MKTLEQRLNNIIGQLQGAQKIFAASERDCFKILIQLKAAKSAISVLMDKMVGEEFDRCLINPRSHDKVKIEKLLKEIINK